VICCRLLRSADRTARLICWQHSVPLYWFVTVRAALQFSSRYLSTLVAFLPSVSELCGHATFFVLSSFEKLRKENYLHFDADPAYLKNSVVSNSRKLNEGLRLHLAVRYCELWLIPVQYITLYCWVNKLIQRASWRLFTLKLSDMRFISKAWTVLL
jgi:hypothetical protein